MTRHIVPRLIPFLLTAILAPAETQSVSVDENNRSKSITFTAPTTSDGEKHRIDISNASSHYEMDLVNVVAESNTDQESWLCIKSTKAAMNWRIIALKRTPLAYVIDGGLTEVLKKGGAGGGALTPKKKPFDVTVPAETTVTWYNSIESHDDTMAIERAKIAVGERVYFKIKNSHLGNPVWTATSGLFNSPSNPTFREKVEHASAAYWVAPATPGNHIVKMEFPKPGKSMEKTWQV